LNLAELSAGNQIVVERGVESKRWSVNKVEEIVSKLGATDCEIAYQRKVVKLNNPMELYDMLMKIVPLELSSDNQARISRREDMLRLDIGGWRFEAHADENSTPRM